MLRIQAQPIVFECPKRTPGDLAILSSIHETYHHRHGGRSGRGAICGVQCRVQVPRSTSGTAILPLHCACRKSSSLHPPLPVQMSLRFREQKNTLNVCLSGWLNILLVHLFSHLPPVGEVLLSNSNKAKTSCKAFRMFDPNRCASCQRKKRQIKRSRNLTRLYVFFLVLFYFTYCYTLYILLQSFVN